MPDLEDGEIEEGELPDATVDIPQNIDVRLSFCSYTKTYLAAGLCLAFCKLFAESSQSFVGARSFSSSSNSSNPKRAQQA